MTKFAKAVGDAIHQLERRNYNPQKAIVYCHPQTLSKAREEMEEYLSYGEELTVHGLGIEDTPTVPNGVVCVVHLDAMRLGPDAIAFETLGESDG